MDRVLEKSRQKIKTTVESFKRLQQEKIRLINAIQNGTERTALLEQLFYKLKVEERYIQILQATVRTSIDKTTEQKKTLHSVRADDEVQERFKRALIRVFDLIEEQGRREQELLTLLERKVEEEKALVVKSEGRHFFSEQFNPDAYKELLMTFQQEQELEKRVLELKVGLERIGIELEAAKNGRIVESFQTTGEMVSTGLLLGLGQTIMLGLLAIADIGNWFADESREDFLDKWMAAEKAKKK